jgi:ankyrin repeat protein
MVLRYVLKECEFALDYVDGAKQFRFRWVDCQFTLLQSCPRTESHLGKLLESLPADLDETYERMLLEVQRRGLTFDLRRVLLLLFYAHTPMVISEVIDGLAVDIDDRPGLNLRRRLQDEDDVLQICSGFVEVDLEDRPSRFHYDEPDRNIIKVRVLRIAHFTVQEYLESDRLPPQLRDNFGLNATLGHQEMVRIFVAYLSDPELSAEAHTESSRERVIAAYPLAEYAAKHWYLHYRQASRHYKDLDNLVLEIFMDSQIYATWSELTKDVPVEEVWQSGKPLPLLYIPALFGLDSICLRLLQMKAPNEYQELVNENVQGFGTVLHAACESGETRTAELLLEHGADANIQGDSYRTALVTATSSGSLELVGMLLKHGADVDTPPNTNIARTALQEAAYRDSVEIVELLLEHGAGVNIQGGDYGTALQAAVSGCSILVAETLLKHGADVNARLDDAFWCGTALQEAVSRGFVETVEMLEMLLEHDADVNIQTGGLFGTALQAAAHSGSVEVVEMLLDHGAEINANTGYYGTALCAASGSGHMDVMRLLIAKKADVNITGGLFEDSALHHAAEHCEVDAVRLLLENGAYIDTRNNSGCTPLLGAASAAQNDASDTASLLLEYGANPNACDEDGGSALYRACVAGGMGVVTVLLADDRTDINAGSTLGTPLEAASALMTNSRYSGDDKIARKIARKNAIVKLLLERGATPTAPEEQERSLPDRSSDTS